MTFQTLVDFDPRAPLTYPRRRFLCPLCGPDKPRDSGHRTLSVDVLQGVYICHRCEAKGKLGAPDGETYRAPKPPTNLKPKPEWREMWEQSGPRALGGTPGQLYLESRGIGLQAAAACFVEYAPNFYNRDAVMFRIRDQEEVTLAVQGRFLDKGRCRMITIGPKKQGCFQTPGVWQRNCFAVTEAPIDAISLWIMGIPAVATCGSGLTPWLPRAARGKSVLIASDADEQGQKDWEVWRREFARFQVPCQRYAPTSGKDWNDVLRNIP